MNEIYIIKDSDPRYGKLGHIWRKYKWDDLVYKENRSIYFYIPPELVTNEYSLNSQVSKSPEDEWDNWIYNRDIERILKLSCNINMQDYFDLLILHINNREDRPKCPICHSRIYFYSIYYGYGSPYLRWIDKNSLCCSKSCSDKLRWLNEDDYFNSSEFRNILSKTCIGLWEDGIFNEDNFPIENIWKGHQGELRRIAQSNKWKDPSFNDWLLMRRFICDGDPTDICEFYVTWTESGKLKFGVTKDLDNRWISSSKEDKFIYPRIIFRSSREEIAYLEASIKNHTKSEYLDPSDLGYLFNLIRHYLAKRPIANPFD